MPSHEQTVIKVNAYVDKRIAPVVEAMADLKNIITEYSCEDNREDTTAGIARAYITFRFKNEYNSWQELGNACQTLSKAIEHYTYSELSVRWKGGTITGIFEFNTEDAYWLAIAIRELLKD